MSVSTCKALYAGTFDPFTNGHMDIVERALKLFDEIVILVAQSPHKKHYFADEDRLSMLRELFKNEPRVKVDAWNALVVDYAKKNGIRTIIRGLRPVGDFDMEFQLATVNRKLCPEIDTVFLMTGDNYYYVSSSVVKEVLRHGGDISEFVPEVVATHIRKTLK